jgi:hypothetical protein
LFTVVTISIVVLSLVSSCLGLYLVNFPISLAAK